MSDNTSTTSTNETVVVPPIKPVQLAHLINLALAEQGWTGKQVTSQLIFGFAGRGALKDAVIPDSKPRLLDGAKAQAWARGFIERKLNDEGGNVSLDELAEAFAL